MLTVKTTEVVEEMKKFMDWAFQHISADMFDDVSDDDALAMLRMIRLMNKTADLAIEQAKVMDEINQKLDKLLAK